MASICRSPRRLLFSVARFSTLSTLSIPFPDFRSAKSAVESEPDPEKLFHIFHDQSSNFARFRRHRPLYQLSCRHLSRSGRLDLVERLIDHQKTLIHPRTEGFWIRLIMLYSASGMVDHALRTFQQMAEDGVQLTEKSLCAVLTVYLDNDLIDELHTVFNTMPSEIGVSPGVKSYNLVLKAFLRQKDLESARNLLHKMENPDIGSYNVLLEGYLKNGDGVGFDEILKEIKGRGLEHDCKTYNHRILMFCKNKESVRAKKLLDEMAVKGVKPNSATYSLIIHGYSKVGDFESAQKVLERMLADGHVGPCSLPYITLFRYMVKEGELDSALNMCKEILKRKWVPPFEAMEGLVKGLVEMSKVEAAKEVFEKMKKRLKGNALDSWRTHEAALPL